LVTLLKHKLKAATLMEVLVAIVIIIITTTLFFSFLTKMVFTSSHQLQAEYIIQSILNEEKLSKKCKSYSKKINEFTIEIKCFDNTPFIGNRKVEVTVITKNNKILKSREIIYKP
jgi:type II secretory pathway pseudopilin PulG|tara:strand:+ start:9587 stop:9931 length:345 start_codon:yes stop_codon:yes gene_type:complete